jgi:hypothetical protein
LEYQKDKITLSQLDVIEEEEGKLTNDALLCLPSGEKKIDSDAKSLQSKIKSTKPMSILPTSKHTDIFENRSKFLEDSVIDQDDSYGNYRPGFLVKKTKVTGRTNEILRLQRMASMDKSKAILGPI